MNKLNLKLWALAGALALFSAPPALAHAKLVNSTPANGAVVTAAPGAIVLTFNEKLVAAFTKADLTMPEHGGMKVNAASKTSADGKTLTVTPARQLGKGAYKLDWIAATADGHKMNGAISFTVG